MNRSGSFPALPPALPGEPRETSRRAGRLSFYTAGGGAPPLLLIHSINAAASAYEVRPIFEAMQAERQIYAPDLPGFGFSDRSRRDYRVRLYVDAVHDMLDLIREEAGDAPIDALALSLSAEFLARAAAARPERFRSLTLVTPTGFERGSSKRRGGPGGSREIPWLRRVLEVPLWRRRLFNGLVSRPSIRFFLKKTFGSAEAVDPGLLQYDYLTAHQPGAEHAPYAFVSGRLFSADIRNVYERLTLPIWVPHATRGDFQDFREADWARARANWRFQAFPTGALPHFEQPEAFMAAFRGFLAGLPQPAAAYASSGSGSASPARP